MSIAYSDKLKNPKWQKKRLKVLERDNWTCTLCGDTETTLNVHHKKYKGEPWDIDDSELKTYCYYCHQVVEYLKKSDPTCTVVVVHRLCAEVSGIYYLTVVVKRNNEKYGIILFSYDISVSELYYIVSLKKETIHSLFKTINFYG
jgi:hypothetical protein